MRLIYDVDSCIFTSQIPPRVCRLFLVFGIFDNPWLLDTCFKLFDVVLWVCRFLTLLRLLFNWMNCWNIASALTTSFTKDSFIHFLLWFLNCASSIPPKLSSTKDRRLVIGDEGLREAFARIKFLAITVNNLSLFSNFLAAKVAASFCLDSFKCFIRTAITTLTRTNWADNTNVTKYSGAVYLLMQQFFLQSADSSHCDLRVSCD